MAERETGEPCGEGFRTSKRRVTCRLPQGHAGQHEAEPGRFGPIRWPAPVAAERETGVADGAADPLADVRARHAEASQPHSWSVGQLAYIDDVATVLAALDAERALAEYRRGLSAVREEEATARAARAEAAIARARSVAATDVDGDSRFYRHGWERAMKAVVAALETETPA